MRTIQSKPSRRTANPPASSRVLEAIAEAKGTDPLDLDVPLYRVVDTDALDALCGVDGGADTIAFDYLDHRVTVHGDGEVTVDELDS